MDSSEALFRIRESIHYTGSLRNLGNSCFLNVILLALASCRICLEVMAGYLGNSLKNASYLCFRSLLEVACLTGLDHSNLHALFSYEKVILLGWTVIML